VTFVRPLVQSAAQREDADRPAPSLFPWYHAGVSSAEHRPSGLRCKSCRKGLARWTSRCPHCSGWTSGPAREAATAAGASQPARPRDERVVAPHEPGAHSSAASPSAEPASIAPDSVPVSLSDIDASARDSRIATGIAALDRVLGGDPETGGMGLVPGSMIVIGGGPGMGKSTLLMQLLQLVDLAGVRLYASGEESEAQVARSASRIGAADGRIRIVREACIESVLWHASELRAQILIVDSMHVMSSRDSKGLPGSDHQVKATGHKIMEFAKSTGVTTIAVCHVNGDDGISGPIKLQHLGDATFMLEHHDLGEPFRVLRQLKNRFGSTLHAGTFEMSDRGLISVDDDSAAEVRKARGSGDDMLPIAQELAHLYVELGGEIDAGLRDRIGGRLDLSPRGGR
jgi:DNA repair protein RadA/Sms